MSSSFSQFYFRRRGIGRAASPPTWLCYEQIPDDDEDDYSGSESESCSEDEEEYPPVTTSNDASNDSDDGSDHAPRGPSHHANVDDAHDVENNMDMEVDEESMNEKERVKAVENKADIKGKQRAVEPEPETPRRGNRRRNRQREYTLRPILTIHKSQGFVWNQDLFVPPYIKDRYITSTSPPNSTGFVSTSVSSTNSALNDYEVEVVEIRVPEGELEHIIP